MWKRTLALCTEWQMSRHTHASAATGTDMNFTVFVPEGVTPTRPAGVLYYLSGLTCTDRNFIEKSKFEKHAAKAGIIVVAPDTSPRGPGVPGDDDDWEFGVGAGFYVDATNPTFSKNYNMYSYINEELPTVIEKMLPEAVPGLKSIMGHSMGGHGALISALRNPDDYASCSAFAPICNPSNVPWGIKAFEGYLGAVANGSEYDALKLLESGHRFTNSKFLIDVGSDDQFKHQLSIAQFAKKCKKFKQQATIKTRPKHNHSYEFVSTFMGSHIKFHSRHLKKQFKRVESQPKPIKCRAAVAYKPNEPLQTVEITVDPPKEGEVRIKVFANALCHTDLYTLTGKDPEGLFPVILGHEAGGVVESVGKGVKSVKPGDHVIPCYTPQCKKPDCIFCQSPKTNLCPQIRATQGKGLMPDGTSRFKDSEGNTLYHYMGCSTFSEYTVLAEISCAKVDKKLPLDKAALFGCGVSTGWGAVWNTTKVEAGSSVAVWGMGAVGLAVVQAAKISKASRIFAIDTNPSKKELAFKLGATDFINPKDFTKPVNEVLLEKTTWGVDYTYDCTGSTDVMRTALESAHRGWGQSCVIGVAESGKELATRPFQLVTGRRWCGTAFGGWKSRTDVPKLVNRSLKGKLPINDYISHNLKGVENVNTAAEMLKDGSLGVIRAVVTY